MTLKEKQLIRDIAKVSGLKLIKIKNIKPMSYFRLWLDLRNKGELKNER